LSSSTILFGVPLVAVSLVLCVAGVPLAEPEGAAAIATDCPVAVAVTGNEAGLSATAAFGRVVVHPCTSAQMQKTDMDPMILFKT
jgi:hypothetical protein